MGTVRHLVITKRAGTGKSIKNINLTHPGEREGEIYRSVVRLWV